MVPRNTSSGRSARLKAMRWRYISSRTSRQPMLLRKNTISPVGIASEMVLTSAFMTLKINEAKMASNAP